MLGASLLAWLAPLGSARGLAMAVLFALAGALGLIMDTGMLIAAQLFKSGVLLRDPSSIEVVLAVANAGTAWLSAASFLLSSAASWLIGPLARRVGASPRWIRFTRVVAGWQMLVSTIIVWAAISAAPAAGTLSLVAGVIAMPILASLWLGGLVREVRRTRGLAVTA